MGGHTFASDLPMVVCPTCGHADVAAPYRVAFERAIIARIAETGPITGEGLAMLRKDLGWEERELAELLDVAPETVARWENGRLSINRVAFYVTASMWLDRRIGSTAVLDHLKTLGNREATTGITHLSVEIDQNPTKGDLMLPTTVLSQKARSILRALLTHLQNLSRGQHAQLTYTDMEQRTGIFRRHQNRPLGEIARWCHGNGFPPINALVVSKTSGHPGSGFETMPGCSLSTWQTAVQNCVSFAGYPHLSSV